MTYLATYVTYKALVIATKRQLFYHWHLEILTTLRVTLIKADFVQSHMLLLQVWTYAASIPHSVASPLVAARTYESSGI